MEIVALHAQPRAGKDTLANLLVDEGTHVRMAFATALYQEVSRAYALAVDLLQDNLYKTRPQKSLALINCSDAAFRDLMVSKGFDLNEPLTSRQVLQYWGTEYRRASDNDYWIKRLREQLKAHFQDSPNLGVVVSDTRVYHNLLGQPTYNEAEFLELFAAMHGKDYLMVEILRDGTQHTGHSSDDRFPDSMITYTVSNNGEPAAMLTQLRQQQKETSNA
jgi:hypothetical protein